VGARGSSSSRPIETSGLLVFAKSPSASAGFRVAPAQCRRRYVRRRGCQEAHAPEPAAREPGAQGPPDARLPEGREAITDYRVMGRGGDDAPELALVTGRRGGSAQLADLGHHRGRPGLGGRHDRAATVPARSGAFTHPHGHRVFESPAPPCSRRHKDSRASLE
jgi:hypothetical protein